MRWKKILAAFMAGMMVLTWTSRSLDSVSVTKVGIGYARQGTVLYEIAGDGTFTASDYSYINLPEGMRIAEIGKKPGEWVEAGETILTLQMERLLEEKETLHVSASKAELLLQQERISARTGPKVWEETLVLQQMEALQKELELHRQDLADAEEAYSVNTEQIRQEYDRKMDRSEEEIREELRREVKSASRAHEAALLARDTAVKKAERAVEDKKKALDRLIESGAEEKAIEAAERALDEAQADLQETRDEHELLVEEAEARLDNADIDYEDRDYNNENIKEELKKNYDTALKTEKTLVEEAKRKVAAAEESLYQAGQKLENARITDAGTHASEQAALEMSGLREQSLVLDRAEIEKKLEKIDTLIRKDGKITAPEAGIVAKIDAEEGAEITSGSQIRLTGDNLKLTAAVDKEEARLLKPGTLMQVKKSGESRPIEAAVEYVDDLSGDGKAEITASIPPASGRLGEEVSFTVKFESDVYQTVIPIEAIREDSKGYFCLAVEPKKTILGEEMAAVRVNLEILEKSTLSLAVTGPLTSKTQIIVSSNKAVGEGDRVRVIKE